MSDIDYQRVSALLEIAERCTGHSGKLSNLQTWAIGELIAVNESIKREAVDSARRKEMEFQKTITAPPADESDDDEPVEPLRRL